MLKTRCGQALVFGSLFALSVAAHDLGEETRQIAELIDLQPGMELADVGAGDGELAEQLAQRLDEAGHVYLTEIDDGELRKLRRRVKRSKLTNMSVIVGEREESGLPDACCDVILLRYVYHHFESPAEMSASLRRSLKPNGLLLVIDKHEDDHGIALDELLEDVDGDGFQELSRHPAWGEHEDHFAVLFRRTGN